MRKITHNQEDDEFYMMERGDKGSLASHIKQLELLEHFGFLFVGSRCFES